MIMLKDRNDFNKCKDSMFGKCDKCKTKNRELRRIVWLRPKIFYICSSCNNEWAELYRNDKTYKSEELFEMFMKKRVVQRFIFR